MGSKEPESFQRHPGKNGRLSSQVTYMIASAICVALLLAILQTSLWKPYKTGQACYGTSDTFLKTGQRVGRGAYVERKEQVWGQQSRSEPTVHTSAELCPTSVKWDQLKNFSKSQSDEDKILYEAFFSGLCNGRYIELGALDGIRYSNTYLFSKGLNWTGILIEASPANFQRLANNRRHDQLHHNAICNSQQTVHVIDKAAVGGIYEFMSNNFRQKWHPTVKDADMSPVKCRPLSDVLRPHRFFDFFSLDVEGGELEVLLTIDFSEVQFGVILVEADGKNLLKDEATKSFLEAWGYRYMYTKYRSAWFVSRAFHQLYYPRLYPEKSADIADP